MPGLTEKIRLFLKKPQNTVEIIVDFLCLAASYVLLFLLPQKVNILFWAVFALAAFLFCIGFFRMGFLLDSINSKKSIVVSGSLLVLCGIILNSAGIIAIWKTQGSDRSVAAAILLLIEAIVMYSITASQTDTPRSQWIMSLIFRVAAVLLIIGAVTGMIAASFSDTSIAAGLLLLIEGIVFWAMGNGNNPFNSAASPIRAVPGMKKTVQELCDALDSTETQLGFPWLGRIRTIKNDTIIYGPSEEGVFVYGYYHFGRFYVTFSKDVSLLDEGEADAHRITEIPDSKGICLGEESLPEAYACMITRYLENGNPIWSTKLKKRKKKQ
ncbi:MAG: hypothetical protein IKH27_03845 [Oscillospiraceae bacterium]|nr:hypothetical protein [Oscillospiraceae bacterium]MBR3446918.1 hypothetical protein [Oscillospiraceae bacterium]